MAESDLNRYIHDNLPPEDPLLAELYRRTYTGVFNPHMISGHLQGRILAMIVSMIQPELILEIGTYTGYSSISMAGALPDKGRIHTIERNDELEGFTGSFIEKSGLAGKITMHIGDALEIIPTMNMTFDMVFIDGDKREYCRYYEAVFDKVKPGGYILADNVLWGGKVVEDNPDQMTRGVLNFNKLIRDDARVEQVILPVRDGITIARRVK